MIRSKTEKGVGTHRLQVPFTYFIAEFGEIPDEQRSCLFGGKYVVEADDRSGMYQCRHFMKTLRESVAAIPQCPAPSDTFHVQLCQGRTKMRIGKTDRRAVQPWRTPADFFDQSIRGTDILDNFFLSSEIVGNPVSEIVAGNGMSLLNDSLYQRGVLGGALCNTEKGRRETIPPENIKYRRSERRVGPVVKGDCNESSFLWYGKISITEKSETQVPDAGYQEGNMQKEQNRGR